MCSMRLVQFCPGVASSRAGGLFGMTETWPEMRKTQPFCTVFTTEMGRVDHWNKGEYGIL